MTRIHWLTASLVLSSALGALTGCGGGGGGPSSPTGTATVQGQLLREPSVQLSETRPSLGDTIRAALGLREAMAAGPQPVPVPNVTVTMSVDGRDRGSTMTDGAGRFRFDGMPTGTVALHMQDSSGRRSFEHTMQRGGAQTIATYCVVWGNGAPARMDCTDDPGDHWDDMMRGGPARRWDSAGHRWATGMM